VRNTVRLRFLADCLDGKRIPLNVEQRADKKGDYPYWGANGIVDYIDEYLFDEPLVLLGEDGAPFFDPLKEKAFSVNERIWVNNHIHVLRPKQGVNFRYLTYALNAVAYWPYIEGSTRDKLTQDSMKEIGISIPESEGVQVSIANYLDRETARIDGLIAEKERMLALLEEKRAALISRVVTRGLDPNAPLKPSGQEWLGEIPAHWRVERAKNLFTVRDERSDDGSEELLTVSHITGVTSRSEKDVYMFEADDKAGYKRCMPGDLAINTLWAWMGAMGISPLAGIVSPDYHVYTSKGELLPEYVDLLCRSRPFVAEVSRWSKGVWSSRLRLYPENFFEMRLPVPPHDEQAAIVRAVEVDQRKANALRESLQLSITLAKERRSALITAAVTGQLSIQEVNLNESGHHGAR
jgi:type I restriction enzyme S subunit